MDLFGTLFSSVLPAVASTAAKTIFADDPKSPSVKGAELAKANIPPEILSAQKTAQQVKGDIVTKALGQTGFVAESGRGTKAAPSAFGDILNRMFASNDKGTIALQGHLQAIAQLRKDAQTDIG